MVLENRNCQSQCKKIVRPCQPLAALPHFVAYEFFIFRRIISHFSSFKEAIFGFKVRYNEKRRSVGKRRGDAAAQRAAEKHLRIFQHCFSLFRFFSMDVTVCRRRGNCSQENLWMRAAAENLKEIVASTLNSLWWWIGHQTYWGVFAWTRGIFGRQLS